MAEATLTVELTPEDIVFVRTARKHYRTFVEAAERHGDEKTAGIMRRFESYAQRFELRVEEALAKVQSSSPKQSGSLSGVTACYTCGGSAEVSVPLQEDGPRRVMVCRKCEKEIDEGRMGRTS